MESMASLLSHWGLRLPRLANACRLRETAFVIPEYGPSRPVSEHGGREGYQAVAYLAVSSSCLFSDRVRDFCVTVAAVIAESCSLRGGKLQRPARSRSRALCASEACTSSTSCCWPPLRGPRHGGRAGRP